MVYHVKRCFLYSKTTLTAPWKALHSVKSVSIWSYSGPYFPALGLNNTEYGHFSRSVENPESLSKTVNGQVVL